MSKAKTTQAAEKIQDAAQAIEAEAEALKNTGPVVAFQPGENSAEVPIPAAPAPVKADPAALQEEAANAINAAEDINRAEAEEAGRFVGEALDSPSLAGETAEAPVFSRPADQPEERVDVYLRRAVTLAPGAVLDPRQAHRMTRSMMESLGAVVLRWEPTHDREPV